MKTNLEIENEVIQDILELTGSEAKNSAMAKALTDFLKYLRRRDMLSLRGKIAWEGDLEAMRTD